MCNVELFIFCNPVMCVHIFVINSFFFFGFALSFYFWKSVKHFKHSFEYGLLHIDIATLKLSKFSIAMLEEICRYFELHTSTIKQKRKKPYIDLLDTYVKSCTCS